ncbi:mechanosensitive ion channel family protein [Rheinheimera maricola]|uniref:Mechanosensitive ion channel family protein n=1 Tax=Rheinheimera maricola TaxID=2793282 RepID=A0ABS7XFP9_9GAMM|nr:mechanosensitive ion channel domain-containing protein [Rheinheimera maricola]MBZ9613352.1 mechanosensitive ion channel family protein [Rheinheimera maricola]
MLTDTLTRLAQSLQLPEAWQPTFMLGCNLLIAVLIVAACFFLARAWLRPILAQLLDKLDGRLTDETARERRKLASHMAHLVPALVLQAISPLLFNHSDTLAAIVAVIVWLYLYLFIGLAIAAAVTLIAKSYSYLAPNPTIPYQGISQLLKLLTFIVFSILIVSTVLNKSPTLLLSGLGALTAVLLLVFKDAILGFVASIQIAVNNMVNVGDWIEMPKYGADGDVVEIALTTVKVRNWDNTITTIPTYALISDSFKNWRGMQQSGGRRIKRAINIDIGTIRFIKANELEQLQQRQRLQRFFQQSEVVELLDSEDITNIALFRCYVRWVLCQHPSINQGMTLMVRQLQSTEVGLPIEIYCFSADKVWLNYEAIQADIFDKLFAILPVFDLAAFQRISSRQELTRQS